MSRTWVKAVARQNGLKLPKAKRKATKYSDRLPRGIAHGGLRCQAMDSDGGRCRRRAIYEVSYHGDPEAIFESPSWVAVDLCDAHISDYERRRFVTKAFGEPRASKPEEESRG